MVSLFLRKVKTASGATAVQIAVKEGRRDKVIEHLGSAHTQAELWPALNKVSFWGCVVGWFWGYRYRMCVWLLM